jgi:hypothetical protein
LITLPADSLTYSTPSLPASAIIAEGTMQSSSSGSRGQWEDYVEQARVKLPEPPPGIMDGYVKWMPWIAIIFGAIGFIFSVVFGLLGAVLSPFLIFLGAEGLRAGMSGLFTVVLAVIGSALSFVGGWKMKQMEATGWWIYGVGLAIGALNNLVGFSVFGLIITLAIAWIHIHVRPRYL